MDVALHNARNELFQELKPLCVALSQLALRDDGSASNGRALIQSIEKLLLVLEQRCRRTDGVFDAKLADYVFFPLSQILQGRQKYNNRLSGLTIQCLGVLLQYGWRSSIDLDLAKQLLLLLTFMIGGVPGKPVTEIPEELAAITYDALTALFRSVALTHGGAAFLVEPGSIPALGHCVTIVLHGITDGPTVGVQSNSLQTLDSLWRCIKDPEAMASFLPATISALTKCLSPKTATRRMKSVIVMALRTFELVLISLLSDVRTRSMRDNRQFPNEHSLRFSELSVLNSSWLRATTGQIKLALSNVVRLSSHASDEVKSALVNVCLTLLDECHESLLESAPMLVETCMALLGEGLTYINNSHGNINPTLLDLATIHPDIGDLLKNTAFNWVTSLPRVMQANDDDTKRTTLARISKAKQLLSHANLDSTFLESAFVSALHDSITIAVESTSKPLGVEVADFDLNSQAIVSLTEDSIAAAAFPPIIMTEGSQNLVRLELLALIAGSGSRESQVHITGKMLEYIRVASGPSVLSAYWLAFHILKSATSQNKDMDEFFESSLTMSDEQAYLDQELYSISLSILVDADERTDWRLQAIALEVIANHAQRHGKAFQTELVDTLYTITQILGSPVQKLREHAIITLNFVSTSCGYPRASDLIVDNVDYMVNAISLRLNTFDISPQAPQIIVMIIRLAGPSLLPYLDDVVASIFAALDNFHGYHRLVEVLFSVLGEIVSVGSLSNQSQVQGNPVVNHGKASSPVTTIDNILKQLTSIRGSPNSLRGEEVSQQPWRTAEHLLDERQAEPTEDETEEQNTEIAPLAQTRTYTMLRSIIQLSQHYLTSSSPHLRAKLLNLISTSSLALQGSENDFLPLVNDIWPVVVSRLYDTESYVQIAATETLSSLCRSAGDFLTTRIRDEWQNLMEICKQAKANAEKQKKGTGGRGTYSQASKVWEGFVGLLVAIARNVRTEDSLFDDMLTILNELLDREDVKGALEVMNTDGVWLAMHARHRGVFFKSPVFEGYHFVDLNPGTVT